MDLTGTKLLAVNQSTSALFRGVVDAFAAAGADVTLVAGYLETSEGYQPDFKFIPARKLVKSPAWRRIWTWGKFALSAEEAGIPYDYRWDRLFEIHQIWDENHQGYIKDLAKIKPPRIVNTIIPLDGSAIQVLDRPYLFEKYGACWLSSTIAYAMACAIDLKPKVIGLWGIDMESREEFVSQFLGVRHFMDLAKYIGIEIIQPNECLMRREPNPYPDSFETIQYLTAERKAASLVDKIQRQEKYIRSMARDRVKRDMSHCTISDVDEAYSMLDQFKGALRMIRYNQRMFAWNPIQPGMDGADELDEQA